MLPPLIINSSGKVERIYHAHLSWNIANIKLPLTDVISSLAAAKEFMDKLPYTLVGIK